MAPRVESSYVPRSYLASPEDFGRNYAASPRTGISAEELPELAASLFQHRAACAVREALAHMPLTQKELGESRGRGEGMISGYMTGAMPASLVELINWAQQVRDPSVLPDLDEVYAAARAAVS